MSIDIGVRFENVRSFFEDLVYAPTETRLASGQFESRINMVITESETDRGYWSRPFGISWPGATLGHVTEMIGAAIGMGRPSAETPEKIGPMQLHALQIIRDYPADAHGVGIARKLRQQLDSEMADGQAYTTLRRLETRGFIARTTIGAVESATNETGPSASRRRGRPRIHYILTASGQRALERAIAENPSTSPGDPRGYVDDKVEDALGHPHQISKGGWNPAMG